MVEVARCHLPDYLDNPRINQRSLGSSYAGSYKPATLRPLRLPSAGLRQVAASCSSPSAQVSVSLSSASSTCMNICQLEASTPVPSPRHAPRRAAVDQAARQLRRLAMERELCEQLGLTSEVLQSEGNQESASSILTEARLAEEMHAPIGRPFSARRRFPQEGLDASCAGTQQGPTRPPKPKPHRAIFEPDLQAEKPLISSEDSSRRWKSALAPLWPDRGGLEECPSSPQRSCPDFSKTAPAAMSQMLPSSTVGTCEYESSSPMFAEVAQVSQTVSSKLDNTVGNLDDKESEGGLHSTDSYAQLDTADRVIFSPNSNNSPVKDHSSKTERQQEGLGQVSVANSTVQEEAFVSGGDSTEGTGLLATYTSTACKIIKTNMNADLRSSGGPTNERQDSANALTSRLLLENSHRLQKLAEEIRFGNRRCRVFGPPAEPADVNVTECEMCPQRRFAPVNDMASHHAEEMKRRLAALDELHEIEKMRLLEQQREMEARRVAQETFERELQERLERELQEHREAEANAIRELEAKEEEARKILEHRFKRHKEQLEKDQQQSRRQEEQRLEGLTEAQIRWQQVEDALEKQWREQEEEEKRRLDAYARDRHRQFEDWDRLLSLERQRFASEAEFLSASKHIKARSSANADEKFYSSSRTTEANGSERPAPSVRNTATSSNNLGGEDTREKQDIHFYDNSLSNFNSSERTLLKELQSVRGLSREVQKAKVKELLFRWHPDKNLDCPEKATQLFQFIQRQRQTVLGL